MKFGAPTNLWWLLLVPALILFSIWAERIKQKARLKFSSLRLFSLLADNYSPLKARWKRILMLLSLLLLILCLARPQWGSKLVEVKKQGIDIIFAVDVSLSMLAEDIQPNRLERAKLEVTDFLEKLKGDRVGIITFAGTAHISCPLTFDYRAAQLFLDNIYPGIISRAGTNLAEAINTASLAFNQKEKKYKVLILVTDGEDQGNQPIEAAKEAVKEGIRIYTIGVGTTAGEPIPLRQPEGGFMGYKKDENDQVVLSRLDEETLSELARLGSGKYLSAARGGFDLDKIYQEVSGLEKKELKGTLAVEYLDRYQYFLVPAILLLVAEMFLSDRKRLKTAVSRMVQKVPAEVASALFLLFLTHTAAAKENPAALNSKGNKLFQEQKYQEAAILYEQGAIEKPESFPLQYNLANAYQRSQDHAKALNTYLRAIQLGDTTELAKAYYNLGNNLFGLNQFQEAAAAYRKALEYDPQDREAKFNYELALKRMQQQASQPRSQKEKQKQQEQDQNQQQQEQEQSKSKQEKQQQQNKQQEQPQNQDEKQEEQKQQSQNEPDQSQLNKKEAERILNALEQKEKNRKLSEQKKVLVRQGRGGKDW